MSEIIHTTLKQIKDKHPCADGWEKLLKHLGKRKADDEPLSFATILKSNGLQDACWALRALEGFDKEKRLFACDSAELVLPIFEKRYPDDKRPRKAIETARLYTEGKATLEELREARRAYAADAAAYAAYAAATAAAADAAVAADAADAAAYAAAAYAADAADAYALKEQMSTLFLKYFGGEDE